MFKSVAVIALPGVLPFEFGIVCDIFGTDRRDRGVPLFDFRICTPDPGTISTNTAVSINVTHSLELADNADVIVVPPFSHRENIDSRVLNCIREAHDRGAWVVSVCGGVFALAEAGILNGKTVTTHWMYSRELAFRYPLVNVNENVLYVQDGTVITSAGSAAGIDACLHLIRSEFGGKVSASIGKGMIVPPHREGGQSQYIDRAIDDHSQTSIGILLDWISEHHQEDVTIQRMAKIAHMSERTLNRRFRAETGVPPATWVHNQRLAHARLLLEETEFNIEEVARASGFGKAVLLRHHFRKALGVPPNVYRRNFRGA